MTTVAAPSRFAVWWNGDIAYSFRHAPVAVVSAVVLVIFLGAALFAPWVAPHNPFDLATLNLLDALTPPHGVEGAKPEYLLGTDDQGRDLLSAIMFGTRISLLVGLAAVALAVLIGVTLGLVSGYAGGRLDAFIMRAADVQLSFPAILIALLIDGILRAVLPRSAHGDVALIVLVIAIGVSNWPQYARTVRGSTLVEKSKEYVQAAPAQCTRTGAGAGHDQHRDCHSRRGHAVVSGRGRTADQTLSRNPDPDWAGLSLLRGMVDHDLPRRRAGDHGARDQSARRLAARRAEPEAAIGR